MALYQTDLATGVKLFHTPQNFLIQSLFRTPDTRNLRHMKHSTSDKYRRHIHQLPGDLLPCPMASHTVPRLCLSSTRHSSALLCTPGCCSVPGDAAASLCCILERLLGHCKVSKAHWKCDVIEFDVRKFFHYSSFRKILGHIYNMPTFPVKTVPNHLGILLNSPASVQNRTLMKESKWFM